MPSARIVLLTGQHLCHNPRTMNHAAALARAGYDVEVLGAWIDPDLKRRDRKMMAGLPYGFTPVLDIADEFSHSSVRLRRKIGHLFHTTLGRENRWQLGYAYSPLRRSALRSQADLYIAHSEQALAVALDLRKRGRRVGVDMEDWFSEDLLPEARRARPIAMLRMLERELLTRSAYSSAPSRAMSNALASTYNCAPPATIYNVFPWQDRGQLDRSAQDRPDRSIPSIHWFSQTIGPGRGLEDLFAALPLMHNPAAVHIRGSSANGFHRHLMQGLPKPWRERIVFHDLVPNDALLSRIDEHDIGFAGESNYCGNRDLTATNKVFQYLLAGLAVVASDTAGQTEIATAAPDAMVLYPVGDAVALARRLDSLLSSQDTLQKAKGAALAAAQNVFCWERQESILLDAVERALAVERL